MPRAKYPIGAKVRLVPPDGGPGGDFQIVSRDFLNTTEPSYRICDLVTGSERRAAEEDLALLAENRSGIGSAEGAKVVPFLRPC